MAAPNVPNLNAPQGVLSRSAPAPAPGQPPSTLDAARAQVVQGGLPTGAPTGGVPTFAQQLAVARGGLAPAPLPGQLPPGVAGQPGAPQAPQSAPGMPQPGQIVPLASHPQFRLYSHEALANEQAAAAQPAPPAAYVPPAYTPGPAPDPAMVALLTGAQATNERLASALEKIGQPAAQTQGPPDPGPMPNAMLEPEKFSAWLSARDARQMWTIEQRIKGPQPDETAVRAQRQAEQEFNALTTPLFNELFAVYPGVTRVDPAALSGIVNAVAGEMQLSSLQALRIVAANPQARHDLYARIARRAGVAPGGQPAAQSGYAAPPAPQYPTQAPAQYAGGFMQPAFAQAPPSAPPTPVWNGQAWVLPAAPVDRTYGMSGGSMLPMPAPAAAPEPQIPSFGAQIAEMQRATGIFGR
jgi:hypothetical protein